MNEVAAPIHPHVGMYVARYEHTAGKTGGGTEVFASPELALEDYLESWDSDPDDVVYIYRVVAVKRLVPPSVRYGVEDFVPAGDAE